MAALAAAALAVLASAFVAPAARAAGGLDADADIPGITTARSNSGDGASVNVLRRGAGYSNRLGSPAVRKLQRLLRSLRQRPGPIDGFYGPLTQAAVERFQIAHGLVVDGTVGPHTGRSLARHIEAERRRAQAAAAQEASPIGVPDAASTPGQVHAPVPNVEDSTEGLAPEWAALIAGLALALLLTAWSALRSRRRGSSFEGERGLNPGLALACLLAALVIGAAGGAVFVGQASPDAPTDTTADGLVRQSQPRLPPAEARDRLQASREPAPR